MFGDRPQLHCPQRREIDLTSCISVEPFEKRAGVIAFMKATF